MCKKVVCFDLDDTLYKEIDFLVSAYAEIANSVSHPELLPQMMRWYKAGNNVFQKVNAYLGKDTPIADYLDIYRNHYPTISLSEGVDDVLNELKYKEVFLGLITDGRSKTQRNKFKALGLEYWFEENNIIISEEFGSDKTSERNFRYFMDKFPDCSYCYGGDNPQKDFLVANRLWWQTIMLKDDGRNIHQQGEVPMEYLPKGTISEFDELIGQGRLLLF